MKRTSLRVAFAALLLLCSTGYYVYENASCFISFIHESEHIAHLVWTLPPACDSLPPQQWHTNFPFALQCRVNVSLRRVYKGGCSNLWLQPSYAKLPYALTLAPICVYFSAYDGGQRLLITKLI